MNRADRHIKKKKPVLSRLLLLTAMILIVGFIGTHFYLKNSIRVEAPEKELGRKVIIELPSGKEVYTYENLIVQKDGKLYYEGERNKIDLTGGKVEYKEWK